MCSKTAKTKPEAACTCLRQTDALSLLVKLSLSAFLIQNHVQPLGHEMYRIQAISDACTLKASADGPTQSYGAFLFICTRIRVFWNKQVLIARLIEETAWKTLESVQEKHKPRFENVVWQAISCSKRKEFCLEVEKLTCSVRWANFTSFDTKSSKLFRCSVAQKGRRFPWRSSCLFPWWSSSGIVGRGHFGHVHSIQTPCFL